MRKRFCGTSGVEATPQTHRLSEIPFDEGLKRALLSYYGDLQLRPAQEETLFVRQIHSSHDNAVISTPTNSGKSLISYSVLLSEAHNGHNVVLVEPLRALAYEKTEELKAIASAIRKATGKKIKVSVTTGDYRLTDETLSSKPGDTDQKCGNIIIATPERLDSLSRNADNAKWFNTISAIVFDEAHLMGDRHRGPAIELLITYLRTLQSKPRIILMSATISNADTLANWISPCEVIDHIPRYPQLEKWLYSMEQDENTDEVLIDEVLHILAEAEKSVIIFVYQTASAEALANKIASRISGKRIRQHDLSGIMEHGVAWFHSKMSIATKEAVIQSVDRGAVRVTVSTTALSMGVNLPATNVYIRDISFAGRDDLTPAELLQMMGRAGRGNQRGVAAVILSGNNTIKEDSLAASLTNETIPEITSRIIFEERENYFGSSAPDDHYLNQTSHQIMGIMNRIGSATENQINAFLHGTLGGSSFTELSTILMHLKRWKLAYQDEITNEYALTRLGSVGTACYMPPITIGNAGQLVRDLLSDKHDGTHLKMFAPIDFLIMLCLVSDEVRPIARYSKAVHDKVDHYMESLPLQEKSYLYRQWIKGDAESLMGSAKMTANRTDAVKQAYQAAYSAMFLYDISRGYTSQQLDTFYKVDSDALQEKERDNAMWMLCGMEKLMEVRCFYYHLKENCEATPEEIHQVELSFKRASKSLFSIVGNLKYRSHLGELIRGIKRVFPHADSYPGEGTMSKLQAAGILSLRELIGKTINDLTGLGIRKPYADLIIGYMRKRSM